MLKVKIDRWGQVYYTGQSAAFLKYERDILSGKIPCPYKAVFRNSTWRHWSDGRRFYKKKLTVGKVVHRGPVPLTPSGEPKIHLF